MRYIKERNLRKNENYKKIIERDLFEYELGFGKSEYLDIFLRPIAPKPVLKLYELLSEHISITRGEFGSNYRENRADLIVILNSHGYDYRVCKPFVDDFETRVMKQMIDDMDKPKSK